MAIRAEDVKQMRARYGMNQRDLAALCNVPVSVVQRWEAGQATMDRRVYETIVIEQHKSTLVLYRCTAAMAGLSVECDHDLFHDCLDQLNKLKIPHEIDISDPLRLSIKLSNFGSITTSVEQIRRSWKSTPKRMKVEATV